MFSGQRSIPTSGVLLSALAAHPFEYLYTSFANNPIHWLLNSCQPDVSEGDVAEKQQICAIVAETSQRR